MVYFSVCLGGLGVFSSVVRGIRIAGIRIGVSHVVFLGELA